MPSKVYREDERLDEAKWGINQDRFEIIPSHLRSQGDTSVVHLGPLKLKLGLHQDEISADGKENLLCRVWLWPYLEAKEKHGSEYICVLQNG